MQRLSLSAPAKLNLFLHITGQRDNGYHNLQTLFQLLDWGDTLHFERLTQPELTLSPALQDVANQNNLIIRAAQLLQEYSGSGQGARIQIDKRIPMGGGLGGGSSNAATTLLALNQLWQLHYTLEQLAEIGNRLGADVPVFVMGQNSLAEGTGDKLTPINLPQHWFLVLKPSVSVETATIFSARGLTRDSLPIRIAAFFEAGSKASSQADSHKLSCAAKMALYGEGNSIDQRDTVALENSDSLTSPLRNDCEPVVCELYPEVAEALQWLRTQTNSHNAMLTGTGACVFARFDSKQAAQDTLAKLPERWQGFVARSSTRSLAHQALYS